MKITVRDAKGNKLTEKELREKQITNEIYYTNKDKIEKRIANGFDLNLMS